MLAAQGDPDAFSELISRHQSVVFNIAYRMLGNRRDAEDAAQDAFIRSFLGLDTFDTGRPFLPWIKQITINICLNRIKKNHPTPSLDEGLPPPREPSPGPEAQTVYRERDTQILAAILSLSPRHRSVIELRHFQNLSYADISEALDRPLSDIKSDLFRARKILAEKLKDL